VRHRTLRIELQDLAEGLLRRVEPERMEQRHPAVEFLLRSRVAGNREVHFAEFLRRGALRRAVVLVGEHGGGEKKQD